MNETTDLELKSHLPAGPWQDEPDRVEFRHEGFACLLKRNQFGAWCGYVAMPPEHPWHGLRYGQVPADVHGGLTYADRCRGDICHVASPGESEDVWWLGFDCAHSGDSVPDDYGMRSAVRHSLLSFLDDNRNDTGDANSPYRDLAFVRTETKKLAVQAKAVVS